ncbi:MAG: hypothetical protein KJ049_04815 [Gammaproteobacteria bacterium]|nr:hypothetical protein [Gammaproteobacteria bacterium]
MSLMLAAFSAYAGSPALQIYSAVPAPNYEITRDADDLAQMTDGHRNQFPIWTNRKSVGWQNKSPVVLKGRILSVGRNTSVMGLNFSTAKGDYAGVYPPMRIDVYCGSDKRGWHHSAFTAPDAGGYADRSTITVPINFESSCSESFAIVIHFLGAFLMLDEISPVVGYPSVAITESKAEPELAPDRLVDDSKNRLKEQLAADQRAWLRRYIEFNEMQNGAAWLSPPWSSLEMQSLSPEMTAVTSLAIQGSQDWSNDYIVGLLNGSSEAQEFFLSGRAAAVKKREVLVVMSVLAANGRTVFDPLRPLASEGVRVPPQSMTYLLIREVASESYSQVLTVTSNQGLRRELQVNVEILPGISDRRGPGPAVVVWSYLSDAPLWREDNRNALISLLREGGVNVFVVHPSSIPLPGDAGEWARLGATLSRELQAYRGAKQVLLYLAWDDRLRPTNDDELLRRDVQEWTARLIRLMTDEGYNFDDWAIYPVDEPKGGDYKLIAKVGEWIKEKEGKIRIYANPGQVNIRDLVPGGALQSAAAFVDIWQPLLGTPAKVMRPLVNKGRDQEWWIYQVGRQPAKAIPPGCYRKLGWEAVRNSATGFGFWSFSDTGKSSAWDDYDGIRPDWAVVYEEPDGAVTSSRRWEAFRQGIRDYRALQECQAVHGNEKSTRESCDRFEEILSISFAGLRCE